MIFYDEMSWLVPMDESMLAEVAAGVLSETFVTRLAGCRCPDRLMRKVATALANSPELTGLTRVKLAILTDANLTMLKEHLVVAGLAQRLRLEIMFVEYSHIAEQVAIPSSELHAFAPDVVLFAFFGAVLSGMVASFDGADGAPRVIEGLSQIERELDLVLEGLRTHGSAQCILQTMPNVYADLFGNMDRMQANTFGREVAEYNRRLGETGLPVADAAKVAERIGIYRWYDDGKYHWSKQPFNMVWSAQYCDSIVRRIANLKGREKKVLVLDLDNTLWGGVVGDDGVDGIDLGNNAARGEAFLAGQRYYKSLANRGVVLCVCSKNDDANARAPFERHPDMILSLNDITCFVANWQDKPANLRSIAETLNLGLDSFVFLDDNPAEREFVRRELPRVAVPEVPDRVPSLYPRIIEAAGYFESGGFTSADSLRLVDYKANARRAEVKAKSSDLPGYLKALEMVLSFAPFARVDEARILQLINRSNQFNLTTRRYTPAQFDEVFAEAGRIGYCARLKDRFSDSGLISIFVLKNDSHCGRKAWEIDTWVMSCRVLGRMVEEVLIDQLARRAFDNGVGVIVGRYLPTAKNGMVAQLYPRLGFSPVSDEADEHSGTPEGASVWVLDVEAHLGAAQTRPPMPFVIEN